MAFSSAPPPARLDETTVAALRVALARFVQDGHETRELHELLRRTAEEARVKGIRAEQLLIELKEIWYSLPEVARTSTREEQRRLLQRLIAHCLDLYYAS